jgi:predicted NodU family carbamoyl transferase
MSIHLSLAFNGHDSSVAFSISNRIVLVLEAERVFRQKHMKCTPTQMETLIKRGLSILEKSIDEVDAVAVGSYKNPLTKKVFGKETIEVNHHLAHAASSYLLSDKDKATIIACDGGGDKGQKNSIYIGDGYKLTEFPYPLDSLESAFPYHEFSVKTFGEIFKEGSLMALAAYDKEVGAFNDKWVDRKMEDLNKIVKETGIEDLALAGGAFLNLGLNSRIYSEIDKKVFIPPCVDDTGQAIGALAYLLSTIYKEKPIVDLPYLGEGKSHYQDWKCYHPDTSDLTEDLMNNYILLVHNGKSEIGPRALGNRSFIARPDSALLKKRLSEKIKNREPFRPLAPIVIKEKFNEYFEGNPHSPFMLFQHKVKKEYRSILKGVIHKDFTARAQTISRQSNPFMYDLIRDFGNKTGIYMLLNTSLNLRGEPLANTIEESRAIYNKIPGKKALVYQGAVLENSGFL